jgi:predicted nucleic-acid-binding Zn-ribbon protein
MDTEIKYLCKNCGWTGHYSELESEKTESCMGNDTIEVCPKCGSMNVLPNNLN